MHSHIREHYAVIKRTWLVLFMKVGHIVLKVLGVSGNLTSDLRLSIYLLCGLGATYLFSLCLSFSISKMENNSTANFTKLVRGLNKINDLVF